MSPLQGRDPVESDLPGACWECLLTLGEAVTGRSSSVRRSSASLCGGNRPLGELVMASRHEVSYLSNQG